MVTSANAPRFQTEWFNQVGNAALPYAVPKTEYQNLFRQTAEAVQNQAKQNYADLTQRMQAGGTRVKLTEEQKEYLAENFSPDDMTYGEYRSFLDTLCRFGVLEEQDRNFLNYGVGDSELELIPLEYAFEGSRITPQGAGDYDSSFASCGGRVLDWARYRAACLSWDERSGKWIQAGDALLFEKIQKVLEVISG